MQRVALVTGAASGIGRAVAARLVADGLAVLAVDLEPDPEGPGELLAADLTTREGNAAAVAAALERHGRLDAVVANAGVQHVAPIAEFPEDRWDALIALLLTSPFLLARYAWEPLAATAVCPAYERTPLVEAQIDAQARAHDMPAERVLEDVILAPQAVKRLIEPEEVAGVVAFLLGPGGAAFTGSPVTLDQGWTAR